MGQEPPPRCPFCRASFEGGVETGEEEPARHATAAPRRGRPGARSGRGRRAPRPQDGAALRGAGAETPAEPRKLCLEPEEMRRGLGNLVLTIVELIRELLERQAVRRVEAGTLSPAEIERLGQSFVAMKAEMERLLEHFGIARDELNLDLGPLGRVL